MKIIYTVPRVRNWFVRHGFSYKKRKNVPIKANAEQQQALIDEYETLRQELPEDETVCFVEGVHLTHNVQSACGWIQTPVKKELPANSGLTLIYLELLILYITRF
jgi:hypothetical protein